MVFKKLRDQVKTIGVVVVIAFLGGALYIGGSSFFGGEEAQMAQASIATVNGQDITYYQFQQEFINQAQQAEQQRGRLQGTEMEIIRFQALESLVGSVLLRQEMDRQNIEASRAEVDEEIAEIKEQFESEEQFQQQLEWIGIDESALRRAIEQEVRMEKLRAAIAGDVTVTDEEVREAYEQVEASHILIRPQGTDEQAWEAAERYARELYEEVTPETFADFARAYSQDTGSAQEAGSIGYVSRGDTVPPFEEAAFALSVEDISEPIRSDFGYHIIMVTDRREASGEDFEAERDVIEQQIRQQRGQAVLVEWFNELRDSANVVIRDPQLSAREKVTKGQYEEAVEYYLEALEEQPDNGYIHASLAETYLRLERPDDALDHYGEAVEFISNDGDLFLAKGDLHAQLDQEDAAVEAYLQASALKPNDLFFQLEVYNNLAVLGRWEDALAVEDRISAIQESRAEAAPLPADLDLDALEEAGALDDLDLDEFAMDEDTAADATDDLDLDLEILDVETTPADDTSTTGEADDDTMVSESDAVVDESSEDEDEDDDNDNENDN